MLRLSDNFFFCVRAIVYGYFQEDYLLFHAQQQYSFLVNETMSYFVSLSSSGVGGVSETAIKVDECVGGGWW